MAAYGYGIWDSKGKELTGLLTPVFFLDRFTSNSGSKTYTNKPPGKTLKAGYVSIQPWKGPASGPSVTVSGNTVTWNNLASGLDSYVYTYWG